MQEARDNNYLLVKQAGTGQDDMQCCSVNGLMPAAWADDPGLYVVAAVIAMLTKTTLLETYSWLYKLFHALYSLGCIFLSLFIARHFRYRFPSVFCVLTVLICVVQRTSDYLPFVNYGIGRGDLFYGFLSVVMFVAVGLVLLVARNIVRADQRLSVWAGIASIAIITAFAELFRSGAILFLPLIFITVCSSLKRRVIFWYAICITMLAWTASQLFALSVSAIRWAQTGIPIDFGANGHGIWHTLYLGLSFAIDGSNDSFGISWSDNYLYDLLLERNSGLVLYSSEYQELARQLYWDQVAAHPTQVLTQYVAKTVAAALTVWPEISCLIVLTAFHCKIRTLTSIKSQILFGVLAIGASLMSLVVAMPDRSYLIFATPWLQILIVLATFSLLRRRTSPTVGITNSVLSN